MTKLVATRNGRNKSNLYIYIYDSQNKKVGIDKGSSTLWPN